MWPGEVMMVEGALGAMWPGSPTHKMPVGMSWWLRELWVLCGLESARPHSTQSSLSHGIPRLCSTNSHPASFGGKPKKPKKPKKTKKPKKPKSLYGRYAYLLYGDLLNSDFGFGFQAQIKPKK